MEMHDFRDRKEHGHHVSLRWSGQEGLANISIRDESEAVMKSALVVPWLCEKQ